MATYPTRAAQILKIIDCPKLSLYRGQGYWYFSYDDLDAGGPYETHSVPVVYLSQLNLDSWVAEGRQFVEEVLAGTFEP